jgi:quercetin dioxygenase-like cupin family protein
LLRKPRPSKPSDWRQDDLSIDGRDSVGALSIRFSVEAADSNGSASIFECFVPADSKMPAPHSHDAFEETIYGCKGVTTWRVAGRTLEIRPGETVCISRGTIHGFENHGTEDAVFLAISSPGVMTPDYFREVHDVLASTPSSDAPSRLPSLDCATRARLVTKARLRPTPRDAITTFASVMPPTAGPPRGACLPLPS